MDETKALRFEFDYEAQLEMNYYAPYQTRSLT